MSKSNIYSISESILLKWMNFHYNKKNEMHPKLISNFDEHLRDSTVFAALIRSHYGEATALKDFRNVAGMGDQSHFVHNANCIVRAIA